MNWSAIYHALSERRVYTVLAVQAVIGAAVAFGMSWSGEQVSAIVGATGAVLALVFGKPVTVTKTE